MPDPKTVLKAVVANEALRDQVWRDLENHAEKLKEFYQRVSSGEYNIEDYDRSLLSMVLSLVICEVSCRQIKRTAEDHI